MELNQTWQSVVGGCKSFGAIAPGVSVRGKMLTFFCEESDAVKIFKVFLVLNNLLFKMWA